MLVYMAREWGRVSVKDIVASRFVDHQPAVRSVRGRSRLE